MFAYSSETVLVTAAAGATGLAVADIAKNFFGCEVDLPWQFFICAATFYF